MKAQEIMKAFPHTTTNASPRQVEIILESLEMVKDLPGAVVELGCHKGLTSVYIQRLLDAVDSHKTYHCYDSFEGLPDKMEADNNPQGEHKDYFVKGSFNNINQQSFVDYFNENKLKLPIIHQGWFKDMDYPEEVCFAFFDGDFYSSILDSFNLIWNKITPGGMVCVHDYGWEELPGVKKAIEEFFTDERRKEVDFFESPCQGLAVIRKKK